MFWEETVYQTWDGQKDIKSVSFDLTFYHDYR